MCKVLNKNLYLFFVIIIFIIVLDIFILDYIFWIKDIVEGNFNGIGSTNNSFNNGRPKGFNNLDVNVPLEERNKNNEEEPLYSEVLDDLRKSQFPFDETKFPFIDAEEPFYAEVYDKIDKPIKKTLKLNSELYNLGGKIEIEAKVGPIVKSWHGGEEGLARHLHITLEEFQVWGVKYGFKKPKS